MSASIRMHLFSVRIFRSFCTSFEPIFMFINKHYCAPLRRYQQCTSISRSSFDSGRFVGVSFVRWITRAHDPFFVRQYANEIIWTIFWMMMCNNNFQWIFISIFLHASNVVHCCCHCYTSYSLLGVCARRRSHVSLSLAFDSLRIRYVRAKTTSDKWNWQRMQKRQEIHDPLLISPVHGMQ